MRKNRTILSLFLTALVLVTNINAQPAKTVVKDPGYLLAGSDTKYYDTTSGSVDVGLPVQLDLQFENMALEDALALIMEKTGVGFIYESAIVQGKTATLKGASNIEEALDEILENNGIDYLVTGSNQIVLAEKNIVDSKTGGIKGLVKDEEGYPLLGANVVVLNNNFGCATNEKGEYIIRKLKPGKYKVRFSFLGFKSVTEDINVTGGRVVTVDVTLETESFIIGNIEVVADNEFIPVEAETKTKISSGEIEHLQASSLQDVMELAPGSKTKNPTLNSAAQASIRGGSSLGTQIIIDDVPISNNVNMQIGIGSSTANSGIDLRSIPAENLESVELVRGIPSVKYGDLVDGLMIVKSKAAVAPLVSKMKYNPNIYEFNIGGGTRIGSWILNGNFNLASSGRDVRIEGDGYTRIAGQLSGLYSNDAISFKNTVYVTRTFDERKEQPGYALRIAWHNKDFTLRYNTNFTYTFSSFEELEATFSASMVNRDSYQQQLVSRDNIVISDRIIPGSQEGRIVFGSYLGKKWIKGREWNLYADVNYTKRLMTGEFLHSFLAGASWRDEFNTGDGIVFDPLYPPSLTIPAPRIRTYDELPSYNTLSLYLEDKITGRLLRPFTFQFGFRYEVYRPDGINLKGLWGDGDFLESKNGSHLNPRFNFSYNLFEKTQIRLSYGVTTKAPPLGMICAMDRYFDIIDTVSVVDPTIPESNFSIVSTYLRQQADQYLQGYKQYKYEASIDQEFGFGGLTLTGFINNTENQFKLSRVPTVFHKYSYPEWPDVSGAVARDTLLDTYSRYTNHLNTDIKGIEFTAKTKRIPVINTIFKFDAAYYHRTTSTEDEYMYGAKRLDDNLGGKVLPIYNCHEHTHETLLLNYRFDVQAKALGLWLTIHIQQEVMDIFNGEDEDDRYAVGYFNKNGETIMLSESERRDERYASLRNNIQDYELLDEDRPNIWRMNIVVSKSLWKGAAVSFYVNNFFNYRPIYKYKQRSPKNPSYERRNPSIFYGMEFHTTL